MIDLALVEALQRDRFPELPLDCGNEAEPGIADGDDWRDWSELETTGPQLRIENYLDRMGLRGKSILNIGIGASGLARRFAGRADRIVGTSIAPPEVERANRLGLPNYVAVLHNKYAGRDDLVPGRFDFIVDDGPTTFCCCLTHFATMLEFFAAKLSDQGQVVIDRVGLGWTLAVPEANRRWSFSLDDLAATAQIAGLSAYRMSEDIYVLARARPNGPSMTSTAQSIVRRVGRNLSRLVTRPARA